ncbi:BlaI/MecI/CopY family transcriptional regulator [Microbulbifer salipaludis]|uniref:BlaI/MecI/CopY family transcriptional regulator n=1 Tax=Microbulbifer salipaludis TaxID=187980 RepID=A0ABS3E8H1_9GAMM|nr:BlaI/MecI/CopY family transcriptional regulator [Microbulbifer salipaludis]MBN8431576.1 BlaI/MecI/CopY family transcriptional regulator [Microbulbifer salipaludis]
MRLGDLEKQVLHYLWDEGSADAKQVHAHLSKARGGSLNTIQSTLDRLFKKGLLAREKLGHAFQYRPAVERYAFVGQLIQDVTREFVDDDDGLVAAFTSISSDLSESQLEQLEQLIEQQKARRQKGGDA